MARIHGCHVTSREAMLFMKYEHYGKCKGSFKDMQRKCKYSAMNTVREGQWIKEIDNSMVNNGLKL